MKELNDESNKKIIEYLIDDKILRNKVLFNFIKMISKIDNNIIAINGNWGSGKTCFVKQVELLINFINNINEEGEFINENLATNNIPSINLLNESEKREINKFINSKFNDIREFFSEKQVNCLYFNAWEYDNNQSPILSIIYKIINDFPYLTLELSKEKEKMLNVFDTISTSLTDGIIKISEYVDQNDLLNQIKTSDEVKSCINQFWNELLRENSDKMIIIIDELDRCRPTYAIKLLEEIKHYINNKDIIIVLATNIYQLSSSIKHKYGYEYNVDEFLDKIIDITLSLQPIDKRKYVESLGLESFKRVETWYTEVIMAYINYRKLEMRSINRFVKTMSFYEDYLINSGRRRAWKYYMLEYIFLPYCLGEQIFNSNNYNKFVKGEGFEEFYKYITSSRKIDYIIETCIYNSIKKEERNLENDMKELYDMIYNPNEDINSVRIGNLQYESYNSKYLFDLCTMLNDFNLN